MGTPLCVQPWRCGALPVIFSGGRCVAEAGSPSQGGNTGPTPKYQRALMGAPGCGLRAGSAWLPT